MAKQKVSPMDYNAYKPKGKPEAVKVSGASIVEAINANPVYQPLDSDLTAIAALSTTTFGRSLLTSANAAALLTLVGAQPLDSDLTAIAALTTTAYGRSVLSTADAAALQTLAGTVIGTNVQAYDAELAALAGLTSAADKLPYFTGSGTAALADLSAAARTVIDDASVSAMRTTLGVAVGTDVQAYDAELAALAGLVSAADKLPYFTGSGTAALADFTAAGRALVDDANAAAQRTTLGLGAVALLASIATANIDNDAVTFAKMQNSSGASKILGRGSASGAGDFEELTISTGLTLTGTVLTSSIGTYGAVAAWCRMNGTGTPAITASAGITSVTDNGVGDYTLNFSYTLSSANYAFFGNSLGSTDSTSPYNANIHPTVAPTSTAVRFVIVRYTTYTDVNPIYALVIT